MKAFSSIIRLKAVIKIRDGLFDKNKMASLLAYDLNLLLGRVKISQMEMAMVHSSEPYSIQLTGKEIW